MPDMLCGLPEEVSELALLCEDFGTILRAWHNDEPPTRKDGSYGTKPLRDLAHMAFGFHERIQRYAVGWYAAVEGRERR